MGGSARGADLGPGTLESGPEAGAVRTAAPDSAPVASGRVRRGLVRPTPAVLLGGTAVLLGYLVLALIYGVLPGQLPDAAAAVGSGGMATCFANDFPQNIVRCHSVGYPDGAGMAFGYAWTVSMGVFQLLGFGLVWALRLVTLITLALGWWGARRLAARFTDRAWIAWTASFALLVSPIMSEQSGYGALQLGFLLSPLVLLTDVRFVESFAVSKWLSSGTPGEVDRAGTFRRFAIMLVARCVLMLLDPYSFMIVSVLAGVFYLLAAIRLVREGRVRLVLPTLGGFAVAGGIAFVLQKLTAEPAGGTEGLPFFRGQGVDLYPQMVPSSRLWWADLTGLHHSISASQAYSDGHNIHDVFWGFLLLVLAALGLFAGFRAAENGRARWLGVGGLVCAVLALGPSLKIADFRAVQPGATPRAADYVMPDSEAPNSMPWAWVYKNLPGIENMRALYRWELGARIALILLAVVGLTWLARRGGGARIAAMVLAALLVVEALPSLPARWQAGARQLAVYDGIEADVVEPLAEVMRPGERVVIYTPGKAPSSENAFMADQICSEVEIRCTNVGGDKASLAGAQALPADLALVTFRRKPITDEQADAVFQKLLQDKTIDAVVLANFDMLRNTYTWPATPAAQQKAAAAAAAMLSGPGFTRSGTEWFTVVRPAG